MPEEYIKGIIQDHHNNLTHRHLGVTRTMELIYRNYNIPQFQLKVEQYIKEYIKCQ